MGVKGDFKDGRKRGGASVCMDGVLDAKAKGVHVSVMVLFMWKMK